GSTEREWGDADPSIFDYLHRDHVRLDALFESAHRLVKEGSCERAAGVFGEFRSGLVRHIRMEEEVLFPAFERVTGFGKGGPTAVMRTEHVEILHLLEEMSGCLTAPDLDPGRFSDLRTALLEVLSGHNAKEEHVLYPMTDRSLPADELRDLVQRMQ